MIAGKPGSSYELKSAKLDLLAFHLKTVALDMLADDLAARLGDTPPFHNEAALIDLSLLDAAQHSQLDYAQLVQLLQRYGLCPIGVRHSDAAAADAQLAVGLISFPENSSVPAVSETAPPTPRQIIDRPVRAGQQIYARDGDLVVLAIVSAGAEVIADGSIHVYAPLRGRALAGARGDRSARIFTQALEAELVSIAGIYRTIEHALPASLQARPAQILLQDDKLVITALSA